MYVFVYLADIYGVLVVCRIRGGIVALDVFSFRVEFRVGLVLFGEIDRVF